MTILGCEYFEERYFLGFIGNMVKIQVTKRIGFMIACL